MCNNTLRLGPQEGLAVVRQLFNNLPRGNGVPVQGEAPSWLGSSTVAAAASPLRVSLQQPCSVPLPMRDMSRAQAVEAEMGEVKLVLLVVFLGKANVSFEVRCSCSCSRRESLVASFQILYFCEKPGARNSFISASSDAARMGAAQTHLELWRLCTLLYPFVSPLLALSCVSNGNTGVMTVLQDSRSCVCAKADHSYPPPLCMISGGRVRSWPWNHWAAIPCGSSFSIIELRVAHCHVCELLLTGSSCGGALKMSCCHFLFD